MSEDDLWVKHKLKTPDRDAAIETADYWMKSGFIVEIRPPSTIASDEYYILVKEWENE